jgi:hypothetical protein
MDISLKEQEFEEKYQEKKKRLRMNVVEFFV